MLLIVLCVPVWILGGAALKQMNKQLLRENVTLINAETTRIKAIISDITSTVYEFSETIVSNTNYIETLSKKKFESDLEINALESTLNHFYQDQANVSSVTLYTSNVAIPKSSHIEHLDRKTLANLSQENQRKEIVSDEQYQNNRILDNTSVTGKWCYIVRKDSLGKDVYELALVRRMWVASYIDDAYLVVTLDNNNLRNRIGRNDFSVEITTDNDYCMYADDIHKTGKVSSIRNCIPYIDLEATNVSDYNDEKILGHTDFLKTYLTGNKIFISVYEPFSKTNIFAVTFFFVMMIFLLTIIPAIIIWKFSDSFAKRTQNLRQAMHKASIGDYDIITNFSGNDDELKETFADLLTTVKRIKEQEAIVYKGILREKELLNRQQEIEYNLLASQINPHFLFNTLETIRMLSLTGDSKQTAAAIKLLGKSLRYVLENTGTRNVTLSQELDQVETYLKIQHIRFGDRVNYNINIAKDVDTNEIYILPFLIQPLVENAIVHGLEGILTGGQIKISIFKEVIIQEKIIDEKIINEKNINEKLPSERVLEEKFLKIEIEDNGIGMSKEKIQDVLSKMQYHDNTRNSIGLSNVFQRVKLYYGEGCSLNLESKLSKGTKSILRLKIWE